MFVEEASTEQSRNFSEGITELIRDYIGYNVGILGLEAPFFELEDYRKMA